MRILRSNIFSLVLGLAALGCNGESDLSASLGKAEGKIPRKFGEPKNPRSGPNESDAEAKPGQDGSNPSQKPDPAENPTAPQPVTGAHLLCVEAPPSDSGDFDPTVLCSLQTNDGLADLNAIFASYEWKVEGASGIAIEELPASSGQHVAFTFNAESQIDLKSLLQGVIFVLDARDASGNSQRFDAPLPETTVPLLSELIPPSNPGPSAPAPAPAPVPVPAPAPSAPAPAPAPQFPAGVLGGVAPAPTPAPAGGGGFGGVAPAPAPAAGGGFGGGAPAGGGGGGFGAGGGGGGGFGGGAGGGGGGGFGGGAGGGGGGRGGGGRG